jgi:hypothetical protein
MDTFGSVIALLVIGGGLIGLVVATVRMIRQDRPATPPGESGRLDVWREEALAWRRLGIS